MLPIRLSLCTPLSRAAKTRVQPGKTTCQALAYVGPRSPPRHRCPAGLRAWPARVPRREPVRWSMPSIDLNGDLGESYGLWRLAEDEALLAALTSVNLACGFHAGDPSA